MEEEIWKIVSYSEIINNEKIIFDNYEQDTSGYQFYQIKIILIPNTK